MQVTFQDCGCIALPDEVVNGLRLSAGAVLELSFDSESRTISFSAPAAVEGTVAMRVGAACPVRNGAR